jgi:hypothetical protein
MKKFLPPTIMPNSVQPSSSDRLHFLFKIAIIYPQFPLFEDLIHLTDAFFIIPFLRLNFVGKEPNFQNLPRVFMRLFPYYP